MLELKARASLPLRDEANLDFRPQSRVVLPVGSDVPREYETRVRLSGEDAPPVAGAAVLAALIPSSTDARLDDRIHGICFADRLAVVLRHAG